MAYETYKKISGDAKLGPLFRQFLKEKGLLKADEALRSGKPNVVRAFCENLTTAQESAFPKLRAAHEQALENITDKVIKGAAKEIKGTENDVYDRMLDSDDRKEIMQRLMNAPEWASFVPAFQKIVLSGLDAQAKGPFLKSKFYLAWKGKQGAGASKITKQAVAKVNWAKFTKDNKVPASYEPVFGGIGLMIAKDGPTGAKPVQEAKEAFKLLKKDKATSKLKSANDIIAAIETAASAKM